MSNWKDKALCKGSDPSLYYDGFYNLSRPEKITLLAKCDACPVAQACFDWAVENKEYGIWGGKDFQNGKPRNALGKRRNTQKEEVAMVNVA